MSFRKPIPKQLKELKSPKTPKTPKTLISPKGTRVIVYVCTHRPSELGLVKLLFNPYTNVTIVPLAKDEEKKGVSIKALPNLAKGKDETIEALRKDIDKDIKELPDTKDSKDEKTVIVTVTDFNLGWTTEDVDSIFTIEKNVKASCAEKKYESLCIITGGGDSYTNHAKEITRTKESDPSKTFLRLIPITDEFLKSSLDQFLTSNGVTKKISPTTPTTPLSPETAKAAGLLFGGEQQLPTAPENPPQKDSGQVSPRGKT